MGICEQCKTDNCAGCTSKYHVDIKRKGQKVSTRRIDCECHHGMAREVDVAKVVTVYG